MLSLYVFTGEDLTSAFKGKGKVGPLLKLQNHPSCHEWSVDQEVTNELEAFTCLMFGHAREKSVNTVSSAMLKKMVG